MKGILLNKLVEMNIKNLFSGKTIVDKTLGIIDKVVLDKTQAASLKFEIHRIIASSNVAKYVRAVIAVLVVVVWLFFPEKFEGREKLSEYLLYAIAGYYYLVDLGLSGIKRK